MKQKYREWIEKHVDQNAPGLCCEVSLCMSQAFPELQAIWGDYYVDNNIDGHAWCVTETGEIVDPTAFQFEKGGEYMEKRDLHERTTDEIAIAVYEVKQKYPEVIEYGELEENNTLLAFRILEHLESDGPRARVGIRRRG